MLDMSTGGGPSSREASATDAIVVRTWDATTGRSDATRAVMSTLARSGISTYASTSPADRGSLLLFIDGVTEQLLELCSAISHRGRDRVLAVWVGDESPSSEDCLALLGHDVTDVMLWCEREHAGHLAQRVARWHAVDALLASPLVENNLVGRSVAWIRALRELCEIGRFFSQTSVLITGETGTGKELAAKLIHTLDPRADKGELVVLDCTTVVPTLSGSEFFGHERGAFTGATSAREGVFALADGGTLFLDEVGELPLPLQAEILRAIQDGAYKPIGSNTWRRTNFRLVCATHRDLLAEQEGGGFRSDLFHRLASFQVELPALRDRQSDILPLFDHFSQQAGRPACEVDDVVKEFLLSREYPGNVRQLRQLTIQMCHRHTGVGPMTVGAIPPADRLRLAQESDCAGLNGVIERKVSLGVGLKRLRRETEEAAVECALSLEGGNVQRAAARLGITARAIQLRIAGRRQELVALDGSDQGDDTTRVG